VAYRTPPAPEAQAAGGAQTSPVSDVRNYLVVIKSNLYSNVSVQNALATYISDVESEGLTVELIEVSGGTHASLRNTLISKYGTLDDLEGCVFIGALPPLWFQTGWDEEFPCELYYMDMDGSWSDTDSNGIYDSFEAGSGDEAPEIYCGRITAFNLTEEPGQTEASLTVRYFNKVHDYREGLAVSNGKCCLYVDDPWRWWTNQYLNEIWQAWEFVDVYDDPYETIASDYLEKIQIPYEHLRVNVHFGAWGHGFGIPPEEHGGDVGPWDLVADPPQVLLYHLYCCVAARWTWPDIIGVWYIMTGEGVGVVSSSKSGGINNATHFYGPVSEWKPMGYSLMHWFESFAPYSGEERDWTMGMLWLGDPTLTKPRLAPGEFALTAPTDGAQFGSPNVLLSWEASVPAAPDETVTYTLIVDNDCWFSTPELVIEDLTDTSYTISPGDGLTGTWQYWKVIAKTPFRRSCECSQLRTFSIAYDDDHDGMRDDWETANGLDPADPTDAWLDDDGDGLLNIEEQDLDTDPHSPGSPLFIYVDAANAGDPAQDGSAAHPYEAIQMGIDAATAPAVVKVLPGLYTEAVVMTEGVWVVGSGPTVTTINAGNAAEGVLLDGISSAVLAGFTITSGGASYNGVKLIDSDATVRTCFVTGSMHGIGCGNSGRPRLINCLVAGNAHNGVWTSNTAAPTLINCTVTDNADYGVARWSGTVGLINTIVYGNGDDIVGNPADFTVRYSDVGDGVFAGTDGNISTDPSLIDPDNGDYRLQPWSPCVDAGTSLAAPSVDLLSLTRYDFVSRLNTGAGAMPYYDMGAHELLDADRDGLADTWENANGLDPGDPADAWLDADGDDLLNVEEQHFASDPHGADSPLFIYVDAANAGDPAQDGSAAHPYEAIQTAIDAATAPAVIKVLPGLYTEAVVMADDVWVIGAGPAQTTIDAGNVGEGVLLETISSGLVAGFTITSGGTAYNGVRLVDSYATIRDCTVTASKQGIGCADSGAPHLVNCLVVDNYGTGVWTTGTAAPTLLNCTVADNPDYGVARWSGTIAMTNVISYGNGNDIAGTLTAFTVRHCNVGDGDFAGSDGNISADPLFVSGPLHAYYLSQLAAGQGADSPSVDTGEPTTFAGLDRQTTRTDSTRDTGTIDMGYHAAYAFRVTSISHGSDVTVEWNAQPGLDYVVEWSLDRETWHDVNVGQTGSWTDTDTAAYERKFYRIREK